MEIDYSVIDINDSIITDLSNAQPNDDKIPNEELSNLDDDTLTSIARSAFADMLWDQERNYLYKKSIEKVLSRLLADKQNDRVNCLDIGAGSGLLSMFMAKVLNEFEIKNPNLNSNNKKVLALEQFFYSYLTAKEIIDLNQMNNKIKLIYNNSLNERLLDQDKSNFLATEVFDTELIGEGALEIFRSAKKTLLHQDALIVPKRANVYCQLIECKDLINGHLFRPIRFKNCSNSFKDGHCRSINNCPGSPAQLNDLQLNSLSINEFKIISDVKIAFTIDFTNPPDQSLDCKEIKFKILARPKQFSSVCVAVWWDLDMDDQGEYVLSCAPYWARHDVDYSLVFSKDPINVSSIFKPTTSSFTGQRDVNKELNDLSECFGQHLKENDGPFSAAIENNFEKLRLASQWRDHWMQAVYYLPKDSFVNYVISDNILEIQALRNDFQFWFNYHNPQQTKSTMNLQPACTCGFHRVYSRNQIRQINDNQTTNLLAVSVEDVYNEFLQKPSSQTESVCNILVFGGMGIIPLILVKSIPNSMIYLLNDTNFCPFYRDTIYEEKLEQKFLGIRNFTELGFKIDILVKDPVTDLDKLPWVDLHEFLLVYRSLLKQNIPIVLPNKIIFKVLPVCFDHLWKVRYVIEKIDSLDLKPFNKMLNKALDSESRKIEMYSLHEYDGLLLDNPQVLSHINVANLESYTGETTAKFVFKLDEVRNHMLNLYGINDLEANRSVFDQQLDKVVPFRRQLTNIAFVIWPEYFRSVNTGPMHKPTYLNSIKWTKIFKQAVYFMPELNRDFLDQNKSLGVTLKLKYDFTQSVNLFNLSHSILTENNV